MGMMIWNLYWTSVDGEAEGDKYFPTYKAAKEYLRSRVPHPGIRWEIARVEIFHFKGTKKKDLFCNLLNREKFVSTRHTKSTGEENDEDH